MSDSPFLLCCDSVYSRFALSREGESWTQAFDSFEAAYDYAEAHATGTTPLTLRNARGDLIVRTIITPLAPELLAARHHWQALAFPEDY